LTPPHPTLSPEGRGNNFISGINAFVLEKESEFEKKKLQALIK
jgi:hypothetical protein